MHEIINFMCNFTKQCNFTKHFKIVFFLIFNGTIVG